LTVEAAIRAYVEARNADTGIRVTHKRRTDAAVQLAEAIVQERYAHQLEPRDRLVR